MRHDHPCLVFLVLQPIVVVPIIIIRIAFTLRRVFTSSPRRYPASVEPTGDTMRPTLLRDIALLHRISVAVTLALVIVEPRVYRDVDFDETRLGLESELGWFLQGAIVVRLVGLAVGVLEEESADLGVCDENVVGGNDRVVFFLIWRGTR